MSDKSDLLGRLYQGRFDDLKAIATQRGVTKTGSVETLRSRLIRELILSDWDLSNEGLKNIANYDLGEILGVLGIKKSGSIKSRKQRLYLHLNHDPKQLTPEGLDEMNKDQLHALCKSLELPLSGSKQTLLVRVAGVLASQENAWGKVKKSLRRPRGTVVAPSVHTKPTETPTELDESQSPTTVASFVDSHNDGWSFEEEVNLKEQLSTPSSLGPSLAEIDSMLAEALPAVSKRVAPPMIQHPENPTFHSLEVETALMELRDRMAEINAFARDFLTVSTTTNTDDFDAFIASLRHHGFATDLRPVHDEVARIIMDLDFQIQQEQTASTAMPQSWSEREALRRFEDLRGSLRERMEAALALHPSDTVKARMAYEEDARSLGLDLRLPSIAGRLHALFDLHVEISESQATSSPEALRRQRMMRILHRGAVHLSASERLTVERLERNIVSFEELVQTVLEHSEEGFMEGEHALVIRFLEGKGYEVNTPNLRPRVLACAGVVGAELGYLSPSDIPKLAPGILVSETEIDSIVTELKHMAAAFKAPPKVEEEVEIEHQDEAAVEAAGNVERIRGKIDRIDDLLNRLQG
ncbi:hypothetical protein N8392_01870 [Candidatus Poseidonia sp.]|nr:hypothetical protein [Poseidonia sp.]